MELKELILKTRSYRRFYENVTISKKDLLSFIDLARLSASAKNMQPLKYIISNDKETNNKIFPNLKWAGFLENWDGPPVGERPSAYIIMLLDTSITENNYCDHGIATQSILLGASEKNFGGCIIAAINKNNIRKIFNIEKKYKILQIISLGFPKENIILTELKSNNNYMYYRDKKNNHYVPKRQLREIVLNYY